MARNEQAALPWWHGETLIPIAAVPQHLPMRSNGRPVSASRCYAYTTCGTRGVRLRRLRGPSGFRTTVEEVQRFVVALTMLAGEGSL